MTPIPTRSQQALADAVGCSQRAVSHAIRSGRLPQRFVIQRGRHYKIRAARFDEAAQVMASAYRGSQANAEAAFDYVAEKARSEHYEAERARLRYLEQKGELVEEKAVSRAVTDAVTRCRDRLLQSPRQLSAECVGRDAAEIERLFQTAFRAALAELRTEANGVELLVDD